MRVIRRGEPLALSFELIGSDGAPMRFPKNDMFLTVTIASSVYTQKDAHKEIHWFNLTRDAFPVLYDEPVKTWKLNSSNQPGYLYEKNNEYGYSLGGVFRPYKVEFDMTIPTDKLVDQNYTMTISLAWGNLTKDFKRLDMRNLQYINIAPITKIQVGADLKGGYECM